MLASSRAAGTTSAVLVLGLLIVAVLVWQQLMGKVRAGVVRAVARGSHRRGRGLVREVVQFHTPALPAVPDVSTQAVVAPGLHLREDSPDRLRFVFGSLQPISEGVFDFVAMKGLM